MYRSSFFPSITMYQLLASIHSTSCKARTIFSNLEKGIVRTSVQVDAEDRHQFTFIIPFALAIPRGTGVPTPSLVPLLFASGLWFRPLDILLRPQSCRRPLAKSISVTCGKCPRAARRRRTNFHPPIGIAAYSKPRRPLVGAAVDPIDYSCDRDRLWRRKTVSRLVIRVDRVLC
jgi:hypothetical protein